MLDEIIGIPEENSDLDQAKKCLHICRTSFYLQEYRSRGLRSYIACVQ